MATTYTNLGPIYLTQEKFNALVTSNQLEVGREYKIVDWEAQEKLVAGSNITIAADGKTISAASTDLSEYAKTTEVTAAVATAVNNLIDGAPETLDTLKEIADNISILEGKQDTLIAGENITIAADGKTISAASPDLTAYPKVEAIANSYSSSRTYSTDDICIYNSKLYLCIEDIDTAEEFNAEHWEELNLKTYIDIMDANNKVSIDNKTIIKDSNTNQIKTALGGYKIAEFEFFTLGASTFDADGKLEVAADVKFIPQLNETITFFFENPDGGGIQTGIECTDLNYELAEDTYVYKFTRSDNEITMYISQDLDAVLIESPSRANTTFASISATDSDHYEYSYADNTLLNIDSDTMELNDDGALSAKTNVSVSTTGTATDTINYITINGIEKGINSLNGLPLTASAGEAIVYNGTSWEKQDGYGYTIEGSQETITWNGDTTDKTEIDMFGYLISTNIPALSALSTTTLIEYDGENDTQYTVSNLPVMTANELLATEGGTIVSGDGSKIYVLFDESENRPQGLAIPITIIKEAQTIIVDFDGEQETYVFNESGIYFNYEWRYPDSEYEYKNYPISFTYGTPTTINKINEKYIPPKLPDGTATSNAFVYVDNEWTQQTGYAYKTGSAGTITWGGDTTDRDSITIGDATFYKVSDEILSTETLENSTMTTSSNGTSNISTVYTLTEFCASQNATITAGDGDKLKLLILSSGLAGLVSLAAQTVTLSTGDTAEIPSTGIFFKWTGVETYYKQLTYDNQVYHTMDAKYIPFESSLKTINEQSIVGSGNIDVHNDNDVCYHNIFEGFNNNEIEYGDDNAFDAKYIVAYNNIIYQLVNSTETPLKGCQYNSASTNRAWNIGATADDTFSGLTVLNGYLFCATQTTLYYASLPYDNTLPDANWTFSTIAIPTDYYFQTNMYYVNNQYIIKLTDTSYSTRALYVSTDLTNWTIIDIATKNISQMIYVNNKYIMTPSSSENYLYYTEALTNTWSTMSLSTAGVYARNILAYNNSVFLWAGGSDSRTVTTGLYKIDTATMTYSLVKSYPKGGDNMYIDANNTYIMSLSTYRDTLTVQYSTDGINWINTGTYAFSTVTPTYCYSATINQGTYNSNRLFIALNYKTASYTTSRRLLTIGYYNVSNSYFSTYNGFDLNDAIAIHAGHDITKQDVLTAGTGIDITDNVISIDDDAGIAIYDNRISNANTWLTNGYTKTSAEIPTTNLPDVCTGDDRWGVLLYVAENNANYAGLQQYFPIDGTYKGRIFYRSVTGLGDGATPIFGDWKLVPWSTEIPTFTAGTNVDITDNTISASVPNATASTVGGLKLYYDETNKVLYLTNDGSDPTPTTSV